MPINRISIRLSYSLLKMGVETVKVLSEIPVEIMQNLLGKSGTDLWLKANSIDETLIVPFHEQIYFNRKYFSARYN